MGLNQKKPGTSIIYLPTGGCDMACKSLKERFREKTMIIEELESSVVTGPKVGDEARSKKQEAAVAGPRRNSSI